MLFHSRKTATKYKLSSLTLDNIILADVGIFVKRID
jgi:hypothetical protein